MRISVYAVDGGRMAVLLEPARGKGLPPVYVRNVLPEEVGSTVERELARIAETPRRT